MTEAAVIFNPFMPGFTDDPYPHLSELREAAAVHQHPLGFWMLTRYDEVSTLLRSGLSVEVRHLAPTPQSEMYLELGGDPDGRRGGGLSMLDRDPPDHTRLRKLV